MGVFDYTETKNFSSGGVHITKELDCFNELSTGKKVRANFDDMTDEEKTACKVALGAINRLTADKIESGKTVTTEDVIAEAESLKIAKVEAEKIEVVEPEVPKEPVE